jgi:hypothetical protein
MAKLRLPESLRRNLIALATASTEQVDQLHETLSTLTPILTPEEIPEQIASKLNLWNGEEARRAVKGILGLSAFRAQSGQKLESLTSDLISALQADTGVEETSPEEKTKLILSSAQEPEFRNVLLRLFSIVALDVTAKALGVLTDNQRSFVSGRVLSDIRPIFQDEISAGPMAGVIVHSLKLEYMESNQLQEFFVSLDSKDLQFMLDLIQRAIKKDVAMRALLEKAQVQFLENR